MSAKILVVDDHPETVSLIEITLQRRGYEVVGALSGSEGYELAQVERPDLILLDIMMPGLDGLEVCRMLRQHEELKNTPIIMFTAKAQAADKLESFEAGADDYLTKPTRPAELTERVEVILARSKKKEQEAEAPAPSPPPPPPVVPPTPPPQRPLFTLLGTRGGAGTTTLAINLAVCFADSGNDTILVDLDTQQGHVAAYLEQKVERDLVDWLNLPENTLQRKLNHYLTRHQEQLELLLSRPSIDPARHTLSAAQFVAMTQVLSCSGRNVVIDLGRNLSANARPVLQASDQIIICLRPERVAISAAKRLVKHLRQTLDESTRVDALMLDFGFGENLPRHAVENYLGFSLLDVFPLYSQQIAQAVNSGRPLVHLRRSSPVTQRFRALAEKLVTIKV